MQANDLLNAAKDRLKLESDYALAKRLNLPRQSMPGIREGKRNLPLDVAYRLAIILEVDPAQVVAELEAERERNPQRAEFWRSFLSRAAVLTVTVACTLAWSFSGGAGAAQGAAFSGFRRLRNCA